MTGLEIVESLGNHKSLIIDDSIIMADKIINNPKYKNIICSVSGGRDSDIMLDICYRVDKDRKITYVYFDTGLEYSATKEHIEFLEKKYDITIEREFAVKPIPLVCKQYGQPFISKFVSKMISHLQSVHFDFQSDDYEELSDLYVNYTGAVDWWCNKRDIGSFSKSMFNIDYNRGLKDFMMANPPAFPISDKCCWYSKKRIRKQLIKRYNCDLMILGIRKAEGGIRSAVYNSCFSSSENDADFYRPIFWYKRADQDEYDRLFRVVHSRCYSEYGFVRTGCAGCPYNINFDSELLVIKDKEPQLYKAVTNVFHDSYEYTRKYREFIKDK